MSIFSNTIKPLYYLKVVAVVCLIASSAVAQDQSELTEEENSILCTYAMERGWEDLQVHAENIDVEIGGVLHQVICRLAVTTDAPYYGNIWEASARYSGFVADIVKLSTRYLLRDNNDHGIFVALVTGNNVPDGRRDGGVFREFHTAWENIPAKRLDLEVAARAICLSIDRYNVQGLDDIRSNECMTPPFVFPPRE